LKLLNEEDSELFLSKSIKIFIEFMWDHYYWIIMKHIFIPFIVYLSCFIFLVSSIAGNYLKRIEEAEDGEPYFEEGKVWSCCLLSFACFMFLNYFSY